MTEEFNLSEKMQLTYNEIIDVMQPPVPTITIWEIKDRFQEDVKEAVRILLDRCMANAERENNPFFAFVTDDDIKEIFGKELI